MLLLLCFAWTGTNAQSVPIVYAMWDVDSSKLISSKNLNTVNSVASITKIMTVYVVLKSGVDLLEYVTVTGNEHSSIVRSGMQLTRFQLINLSLVSSDNLAARTLAETSPQGYDKFISEMNKHANKLGMKHTKYADVTGLSELNVSTAEDTMKLILAASEFKIYHNAAMQTSVSITVKTKKNEKKVTARATNYFAGKMDIQVAKTGFTRKAGRCITMLFRNRGNTYALVVMGAITSKQRTKIVKELIEKSKI